ncbi:MAG: hypothetical protein PHP45_03465 [Elusimicrobiales bacterium]|nr:hypothetical protein [Elusimicrobiales bacterium]
MSKNINKMLDEAEHKTGIADREFYDGVRAACFSVLRAMATRMAGEVIKEGENTDGDKA